MFIAEVKSKRSDLMATDEWTVKDVLCHIVFWHENYAANYKALAEGKEPPLLDGPGYKLNTQGVASLRRLPIKKLIAKLREANRALYISVVQKRVPRITYKKNGRVYKTADFLELVARHVRTHTIQARRAK